MNTSSTPLHVICGTGPAACWAAVHLRAQGMAVQAVNRSGLRPALMPADVPVIAADLLDPAQAVEATRGATVIYQALGPAYTQWAELFPRLQASTVQAAMAAGARYVALENLYMLDATGVMTETSLEAPRSTKGRVRQTMHRDLMQRHQRGDLQVCALRASDYYGPGVTVSAMGERVFGRLVKGQAAQVMGRADVPHSLAYIGDVGRALAALGTAAAGAPTWGRTWLAPHAPAQTQAQVVERASALLQRPARLSAAGPWMMRLVGLFDANAKASIEMLYQFTRPFVVDAQLSDKTLGLAATPLADGLQATVDWYRTRQQ